MTLLHFAARDGKKKLIKMLLRRKADPNLADDEVWPVSGSLTMRTLKNRVKIISSDTANRFMTSFVQGHTPLITACMSAEGDAARTLIEGNADVNAMDQVR